MMAALSSRNTHSEVPDVTSAPTTTTAAVPAAAAAAAAPAGEVGVPAAIESDAVHIVQERETAQADDQQPSPSSKSSMCHDHEENLEEEEKEEEGYDGYGGGDHNSSGKFMSLNAVSLRMLNDEEIDGSGSGRDNGIATTKTKNKETSSMMISAQGHNDDHHNYHHHHEHRRRYSLAPSLVASETSSWDEEEDDDDDDDDDVGKGNGNPNSNNFLCDFDLFENLPSSIICDDFVVCQQLTTAPQHFSDSSAATAASWSKNRNMNNNDSGNFLTDFTNQLQLFLSCRHPLEYLGLLSEKGDDYQQQQQQVEGGEEGNRCGQQQQQEPPPQQHTNRSSGYHSLSQSCEYCGSPDISLCRPAEGVVPFSTFLSTRHDTTSTTSTASFNCLVVPSQLPSSTNINITANPVTDAFDCSQSETSNEVPVLSDGSNLNTTMTNFSQETDPNNTTVTAAANETYPRCHRPTSFFARRRPPFCPKSSTEWDTYDFKIIEL